MNPQKDRKSKLSADKDKTRSRLPVSYIVGVFGIIAVLIGAYSLLVANNKLPNPFGGTNGQISEIAGTWAGPMNSVDGMINYYIEYVIQPNCEIGQVCGTWAIPELACKGNLIFNGVAGQTFEFDGVTTEGADVCASDRINRFTLYSNDQLSVYYSKDSSPGDFLASGILTRK